MAECAAELTEVLDRLDRVEKESRRRKRSGLAVLVLADVGLLMGQARPEPGTANIQGIIFATREVK